MFDLAAYLAAKQPLVDERLGALLARETAVPTPLGDAMRYSLLAPGKRLRPMLVLMAAQAAGVAAMNAIQTNRAAGKSFEEACAAGITILLVDQNITKAVEVSQYLYVIEGGQVRREGPQAGFADHLRELIRDSLLGA